MPYRRSIVFVLLTCLVAHVLPLTGIAQRRPIVNPTRPANTSPAAKFDPDTVERMESKDTGNNYAHKGLPAPAEYGGPPSDGMAAAMAKQISDYEKDNLPLLITMLQRAGFFIIDTQQKVLYQPTTGTGTGLAFYDFEVAGMYKLSRRGAYSSVEKMAGIIGKDTPEMPPAVIANTILRDLRAAYNSAKPLVRFWARLIVEFGRNAEAPVDLMTAAPAQASLNVIQTSLWERRLIGDMVVIAQKASTGKIVRPRGAKPFAFMPASYGIVEPPCQTGNIEGLILDGSALAITTGHGEFMKLIESTLSDAGKNTFGKIATGLGIVNMVLAWAKLVAAVMTLKGEIKIADPMPLVRTKNSVPGEYRMMTARVWAEVGNLQVLNCVRLALNTASGLDFNMPSDGPLGDRDIGWYMTGDSSFGGQGSSQTGKFDNFVNFEAPDGANRDPQKQISDDNGESKMNLVGGPKIPTVINKPVVPVRKKAGVMISVALKSPRDKAQNFLDMGGGALAIALSGPIAIISILPEIGFRMPLTPARITVPVKDWQLCTSDWAGTINMSRKLTKTEAIKTSSRTGTRKIVESMEADFVLNPRKRDVAEAIPPPKPADVHIKIDNTDIFEGVGEADVCCSLQSSKDPKARIRDAKEFHSDRMTTSHVHIDLSERLLLDIRAGSLGPNALRGTQRNSLTVSESACPYDEDKPAEETFETTGLAIIPSLDDTKTGRRLLNQGESLEELWGRESYQDASGADIVIIWSLARCGED